MDNGSRIAPLNRQVKAVPYKEARGEVRCAYIAPVAIVLLTHSSAVMMMMMMMTSVEYCYGV